MKRFTIEHKFSDDEHIPYIMSAEGNTLEELLDDATFCVDCPDPSRHLAIEESSEYERLCLVLAAEVQDQLDYEREAREARAEDAADEQRKYGSWE